MTVELARRIPIGVLRHRPPTYRCPCCNSDVPTFQLRTDVHGVPRRVDVSGDVCRNCLMEKDNDAVTGS